MADEDGQYGANSEVGRLRTGLLHRPGPEIKRLTPRNSADLLFDGIPWVARAQEEHHALEAALRARDVDVLASRDLLVQTLAVPAARAEVVDHTLADQRLGTELRDRLG